MACAVHMPASRHGFAQAVFPGLLGLLKNRVVCYTLLATHSTGSGGLPVPLIPEGRMQEIIHSAVLAMGADESAAADVTASLIAANMEGMDSHGVLRLPLYATLVDKGLIDPKARPEVERQDRAVTLLDGRWCFGQVGARVATRHAIAAAREHGIGAAGIHRVLHVGRLKDYVQMVGRENMIGICYCSAGPAGGSVAPYRGATRRFGTNPLAVAVPRPESEPMVADFATSIVAEGKLKLAVNAQRAVPDNTIIDAQGSATNDPKDFYAGGALLPFGAHKGYCLSLFIDIIGGLLVGAGAASLVDQAPGNGFFIIALDVSTMRPAGAFMASVEDLLGTVKNTPAAAGQPPVLLPGEPEDQARSERGRSGIPVDDEAWAALRAMGARLNLPAALFVV